MNQGMKTSSLFGLALVLAIIAALLLLLSNMAKDQRVAAIDSYAECAAAGYPIMESYPTQCMTPDGRNFVNPEQSLPSGGGAAGTFPAGECVAAGCSQTICVEAGEASDIITTCEYRVEYACYRTATCERQASGQCGWTETEQLAQCLANPPALEAGIEAGF
jgi:hypothetical protein